MRALKYEYEYERDRSGSASRQPLQAPRGRRTPASPIRSLTTRTGFLALVVGLSLVRPARADEGAIPGYRDYDALTRAVAGLAVRRGVWAQSLASTRGGRSIWALTLAGGLADADRPAADRRPALLIVGNVYAPQLVGSALAFGIAERLADGLRGGDKRVRPLLARTTIYVIPRPSPDASEAFFQRPYRERPGNLRPTDDDRDGEVGEDAPVDLNEDGWITRMRIREPGGAYLPHPQDPRVLVKADPVKGERGLYRVVTEGLDQDRDEAFAEDPAGGVDLDRSFPYHYAPFTRGAGPRPVCEVEARALADFVYDHPNIVAVLSFAPEDNLVRPWKPDPKRTRGRIKEAILPGDAPVLGRIAARYLQLTGLDPKGLPKARVGKGAFSEWAYFHAGRWSFCARGFWIPTAAGGKAAPKGGAATSTPATATSTPATATATSTPATATATSTPATATATSTPATATATSTPATATATSTAATAATTPSSTTPPVKKTHHKKSHSKKRGSTDRNALSWFASQGLDGFVGWGAVRHPALGDRTVEVGGFRPFLRWSPPAAQVSGLVDRHLAFALLLGEALPRLREPLVRVTALGGGVFRVEVTVTNDGALPTAAQMGEVSRWVAPVEARLRLPEGASSLSGPLRQRVPRLAGLGGSSKLRWLVRARETVPRAERRSAEVTCSGPTVGTVRRVFDLKPEAAGSREPGPR